MTITRNEIDQKYQLLSSSYSVKNKKIGSGTYANVYLGMLTSNNTEVAVKVLGARGQNGQDVVKEECRIMGLLSGSSADNENSKYVVKFFGYRTNSSTYHLVLEYMDGNTLRDWIYCSSPTNNEKWKDGYKIITQIIKGICYLHHLNIIHRDIKPDNVFLSKDLTAKIGDFGLSYQLPSQVSDSSGEMIERVGTLLYMAPEVIKRTSRCSKSSDIFGFGMLLGEIEVQQEPYPDVEDEKQLLDYIDTRGCVPSISKTCHPKIEHLIKLCLATESKNRPTAEEIVEDLKSDISVNSILTLKSTL